MEKLINDLKQIQIKTPEGLHKKIMSRLFFLRFKRYFLIGIVLLSLNLILISWHIWSRIIEKDILIIIQDMIQEFDLSWVFIEEFITTILEYLPLALIITFVVNVFVMGYLISVFFKFKKNSVS